MANLWRVSRPGTDLPMVMKIPLMRHGEDPITIVGFEVEGMILPRLTGPHVPRFVKAGDFSKPYIVMELIAGRSVRTLLDKTPLAPDEVAAIGAKIAFALHDLHRQHVIHLDLKPSNVILRDDGEAALIDFGLSRHDQLPDLVAEEIDGPIGTGPYISPEQVLRRALRSAQRHLRARRHPLFPGHRRAAVRRAAARANGGAGCGATRCRRGAGMPKVPPWLQEIILRCLEVDPAERPRPPRSLPSRCAIPNACC